MRPPFEELREARFTFPEMDAAYGDGIEDTCDKVIGVIQQSDFGVSLEDLVAFLEAEKGFQGDPVTIRPDNVGDPVRDPIVFAARIRALNESERSYPEAP